METFRKKLHRKVGGFICNVRKGHSLNLVSSWKRELSGDAEHTSRPMCLTCWEFLGD